MTSAPGVHPSQEALAEFAGGPGGPGDPAGGPSPEATAVRNHLDHCASCRDEVAMLRNAAQALATLAEPPLPPGLHDRLVAAVRAEQRAAAGAPAGATRAGRRRERAWRPFGWAVAAAATVVLAVAGVTQLGQGDVGTQTLAGGDAATEHGADDRAAAQSGGSGTGSGSGAPAPVVAPEFAAAGDYSIARLRADLASRPDMRAAYQAALAGARRTARDGGQATAGGPTTTMAGPFAAGGEAPSQEAPSHDTMKSQQRSGGGCRPPAPAGQEAFLVEASYGGRPAIVVVSVTGDPPMVRLEAYARGDCTLLGTEQGAAPAP